jgi:hypothetical protein
MDSRNHPQKARSRLDIKLDAPPCALLKRYRENRPTFQLESPVESIMFYQTIMPLNPAAKGLVSYGREHFAYEKTKPLFRPLKEN